MRIRELVWDDLNEAHVARHGLHQREVEEAAFDRGALIVRARGGRSRSRYLVLGVTQAGKPLMIILEELSGGSCLVVTAREMEKSEKRRYRTRGR